MNKPKQNAPGQSENVLEAKLPGSTRIYIKKTDRDLGFDEPVYAINWFDTNSRFVYDFYNLLAVWSVKAVGGAPYFKGRLKKILHGEEAHRRDVLLVVRYPALKNFKTMLESTFFIMVSLLRVVAVRDFTFGFTKRCDDGPDFAQRNSKTIYAVHHYKGHGEIGHEIARICNESDVEQVYAGAIGAFLSTGDVESVGEQIPCLMDAIVILRADSQKTLEALVRSESYQSVIEQSLSSFVGIYDRVL